MVPPLLFQSRLQPGRKAEIVSLKAMLWVMEEAPIDSPAEGMILYALADRASDDGTAAWPSQQWIADRACCSKRTVIRHLQAMEDRGLIRRGDQRHVAHIRFDKRPIVWDLALSLDRNSPPTAGGQNDTSMRAGCQTVQSGVTNRAERGDTGVTQTVLNPPEHTQPEPATETSFEVFWGAHPRSVKKSQTKKHWEQAIQETPAETILTSLQKAIKDWRHLDRRWIPQSDTWLRERRWEEHMPAPERPKPRRCELCEGNNGMIQVMRPDGTPALMRCRHDTPHCEADSHQPDMLDSLPPAATGARKEQDS